MDDDNETQVGRWVDDRLATLSRDTEWHPDIMRGLARLRQQRGARRRPQRWAWAAAAATASLALIALPAPRVLAQHCLHCSVAFWQGLSTAAPVRADQKKMAPDFALDDASDKPVRLSDFRGKVVLLNFWATWCGGCRVEIPWLIEFQQAFRDRGLVVLGVSFDEDGWKLVKPFIAEKKINYRVMIGNRDIAALYGAVESLPMTLIIDRSGYIVSTHVGLPTRSAYQSEIEALLNK